MKIEIKETGRFIEYKNFHFADIYDIFCYGKLVGQKMVDKGTKMWYAIYFDSENESKIENPERFNFGEGVIYAHNIKEVKEILETIYKVRV